MEDSDGRDEGESWHNEGGRGVMRRETSERKRTNRFGRHCIHRAPVITPIQ